MCQIVRFMTHYCTNKCKSQVIGLLYQSIGIKNHPNTTKRVAKPKFSNMNDKDI